MEAVVYGVFGDGRVSLIPSWPDLRLASTGEDALSVLDGGAADEGLFHIKVHALSKSSCEQHTLQSKSVRMNVVHAVVPNQSVLKPPPQQTLLFVLAIAIYRSAIHFPLHFL